MLKVDVHAPFMGYNGTIGKIVYRKYKGQLIASLRPDGTRTLTQTQIDHQERFRKAAKYGRRAMADSSLREFYEQLAKELDQPIFSLMVADYLKPPSLEAWDISAYGGQPGNLILLTTDDNVGVVDLTIQITDDQGAVIESGRAVETASGSAEWVYTAKASVPAGKTVTFKAVATDRPGGTAVSTNTKTF